MVKVVTKIELAAQDILGEKIVVDAIIKVVISDFV